LILLVVHWFVVAVVGPLAVARRCRFCCCGGLLLVWADCLWMPADSIVLLKYLFVVDVDQCLVDVGWHCLFVLL